MGIRIKKFIDELFDKDKNTINLPEELIKSLQSTGLSELESLEKSDMLINKIKREIEKKIRYCKTLGTTPRYRFDDTNNDIIVREDLLVDPHRENKVREIIVFKQQINEVLKKISWIEFEKVCKLLLEINEIQECIVTRGSKDGGIDVYGWFKSIGPSKRLFREIRFRVIGQGKHRDYGSEVNNAEVSEFVTDIEKLRKKQGFSLFVLPPKFLDSPLPLIPIFITNGHYCPDSILTATNHGIILWNGEQISEDIATYFDLSLVVIDGKINEEKFRRYLENL